jgi:hypothetical protein
LLLLAPFRNLTPKISDLRDSQTHSVSLGLHGRYASTKILRDFVWPGVCLKKIPEPLFLFSRPKQLHVYSSALDLDQWD